MVNLHRCSFTRSGTDSNRAPGRDIIRATDATRTAAPQADVTWLDAERQPAPGQRAGDRGSGVAFRTNPPMPAQAAPRLIQRGELLASLDRATTAKVTPFSQPPQAAAKPPCYGPGQMVPVSPTGWQSSRCGAISRDSQQFWLAVLSAIRQAVGHDQRRRTAGSDTGLQ